MWLLAGAFAAAVPRARKMAEFIEEAGQGQLSLLSGSLDDWVGKDNAVRRHRRVR